MRTLLGIGTLLVGILLVGIGAQIGLYAVSPLKAGPPQTIDFLIPKGTSPHEITRLLGQGGLVSDTTRFFWLGRLTRQWNRTKSGEYEISSQMSPMEVFKIFASGLSIKRPVTLREGINRFEIAALLEEKKLSSAQRFVELTQDPAFIQTLGLEAPLPATLEGYLFPDTYFFNRTLTPEDMARQMVQRFRQEWTAEQNTQAQALGLSRDQILTLASIVEKETGAAAERPKISSVFHNRLKKKMRIQSDPTVIYGIWDHYAGNLTKDDLRTPTPYNTYTIPALPIGPISNPGRASIQAALAPEPSEFLFFVSHNDGTHEFTRSYKDHLSAVRTFQLDPKAREGKSWRDLSRIGK